MTQPALFDVAPRPKPAKTPRAKPARAASTSVGDADPFLSTRACADWTGYSTSYFRLAIRDGDLRSEYVRKRGGARGHHLIRFSDFVAFLKANGFTRIPKSAS